MSSKTLRVGTITFVSDATTKYKQVKPTYKGFKPIDVMTASSAWGMLGPYCLQDHLSVLKEFSKKECKDYADIKKKGPIVIHENFYQGSKCYEWVPSITVPKSNFDKTIIFESKKETHFEKQKEQPAYNIKKEYWEWRKKVMKCPYPIRYPVGKKHRHECIGFISEADIHKEQAPLLNIVGARLVYLRVYVRLVKLQPKFQQLKKMYDEGTPLLIREVDGAKESCKEDYEKNGINIENNTVAITKKTLKFMLKYEKASFGHGFALCWALMDLKLP